MSQKKYNIFISYGWADNQPFAEGSLGWVSTFVNHIRKHLGRELPRQYTSDGIWLDYEQLRGSDSITASIRAKLEASRILMPIVSRSYLDSPWCQEEREIFLRIRSINGVFPRVERYQRHGKGARWRYRAPFEPRNRGEFHFL